MKTFKQVGMTISNDDVLNKQEFEIQNTILEALNTLCDSTVNFIKIDVEVTDVEKIIELTKVLTELKQTTQFNFLVCFFKGGKNKKCYKTL